MERVFAVAKNKETEIPAFAGMTPWVGRGWGLKGTLGCPGEAVARSSLRPPAGVYWVPASPGTGFCSYSAFWMS